MYSVYGGYSENDLERITCAEMPWKNARRGYAMTEYIRAPISFSNMKKYYGARIGKACD